MTDVPSGAFDDLFEANAKFAAGFENTGLPARAARGLAVLTCMDSRLDPFAILGIGPGDAKVLRNAGGRVTEDVLRTLVLGAYLLNVRRVLVMPHTKCAMAGNTEDEIHAKIQREYDVDTRSLEFRTTDDQLESLRSDIVRIQSYPLLPRDLTVGGAIFDVDTGRLEPVALSP
ncbi:MAG TPA: carbonic anhydrase [Actinomycetes bacterium]|nr:carbonic anhydrase [Actinomycetes bacterium]